MELHQSLGSKRLHQSLVVDDILGQALPPHYPSGNTAQGLFLHNIQTLPEVLPLSCAATSGIQISREVPSTYHHKRRRLNTISDMTPNSTNVFGSQIIKGHSSQESSDQLGYNASLAAAPWPAYAGSFVSETLGSPLCGKMAGLSMALCPCCGFDGDKSDGYQPLSDTSLSYDVNKPYSSEKQPSMQLQLPYDFDPANNTTNQRNVNIISSYASDGFSASQPSFVSQEPLLNTTAPVKNRCSNASGPETTTLTPEYLSQQAIVGEEALVNEVTMQSPAHLLSCGSFNQQEMTSLNQFQYPLVQQSAGQYSQVSPTVPEVTTNPVMSNYQPSGKWYAADTSQKLPQPNFNILLPSQRGGKRGPFKDPALREQTAKTRKMGSCIRCRMQRIRCEHDPADPDGVCLTCEKVTTTRVGRFPCLRYKITDIRLHKPGQVPGYEWSKRWDNSISDPIQKWASPKIKVIRISEGYSNMSMNVQVRQFVPQDGDKLERSWSHHGNKKSVIIPFYAAVDLDDVKCNYTAHMRSSMRDTLDSVLGSPRGLLFQTYDMAWRICYEETMSTNSEWVDLLNRTLRLWMSIRLSTTSCFIVGDERLGMPADILDESSPTPGRIPLPPVLGAQLDLVLIHHIQAQARRDLLDRLQKIILKNKQTNWFVTYLVTFILLHNTALITEHDAQYAVKHGMKRRYAREEKVKEYHIGANILLAYFHYCNRGVYPFADDCSDEDLKKLAGLDEEKIKFVHMTRKYAKQHRREWSQLWEKSVYDDGYFFVSQLFEDNWQPRSTL